MFSESFIIGHSLRILPTLNPNQSELEDDYIDGSVIKLLDSPEVYEINRVLSIADDEVDSYLRQLSKFFEFCVGLGSIFFCPRIC